MSPNPFWVGTEIRFELATRDVARVNVFDAGGRLVLALRSGRLPAGVHSMVWDGRNQRGNRTAPGVYFVELITNAHRSVRRAVFFRPW